MKKHIRIKFVDFWDDFVPENNLFYQLLSEHYDVELSSHHSLYPTPYRWDRE